LEEESDEDTRYYALELIENSAKAAWAELEFHRLAYGAAAGLGAAVPLKHIEQVARRYIETGKHRLHWQSDANEIAKEHAKLILALLAVAQKALPAGGDFYIGLAIGKGGAGKRIKCVILCRGRAARVPEGVADIFAGRGSGAIDSQLVTAYLATRLAGEASLKITAAKDGEDIVFTLEPK
jgi:histidine phosphotransferase ChpT